MYTDKMVDRVKAKLDRRALNGVIDLFGFDIDVEHSELGLSAFLYY